MTDCPKCRAKLGKTTQFHKVVFLCPKCNSIYNALPVTPSISLDPHLIVDITSSSSGGISIRPYREAVLSYVKPMSSFDFFDKSNADLLFSYIDNIVLKESPISLNYLYSRLMKAISLTTTSNAFDYFDNLIKKHYKTYSNSLSGGVIIWSNSQSPSSYQIFRSASIGKRCSLADLSYVELHNVLRYCNSIFKSKRDVIDASALLLGYSELPLDYREKFESEYNSL